MTTGSPRHWTPAPTILRTRQRLVEEGLDAALTHKYSPSSARPRIFDGAAEAKLITLARGEPPRGRSRWTLELLEEQVVELRIVERATDNTIGRALKKRFQAPPARTMGHSARRQRGRRSRHGGYSKSISARMTRRAQWSA
jgi:hypothetical protein